MFRASYLLLLLLPVLNGLVVSNTVWAQSQNSGLSNYSIGVEAFREGAFRRAFDAWSLGAYEGDAEAQYNLGVLYLEGRGVERNPEQARNWFLRAAEKQHLEAQYNLGHMSLSGMGVEKSIDQALDWWRQAAEGGYPQAQFNYGRAVYLGVGDIQDRQTGLVLIREAAAQNDERAQQFLDQNKLSLAAAVQSTPETQVVSGDQAVSDLALTQLNLEQAQSRPAPQHSAPALELAQPVEQKTDIQVAEHQPGKVKLNIVRDEPEVRRDYYLRTINGLVPVYALPDLSNKLDTLLPRTLVKVLEMRSDKLKVEVVSRISAWTRSASISLNGEMAQASRPGIAMYSSPAGEQVGELPQNKRLQILEQQQGWVKLSIPQVVYGWIAARSLAYSGESSQQLQALWLKSMGDLPAPVEAITLLQVDAQGLSTSTPVKEMSEADNAVDLPSVYELPQPDGVPLNDNTWLFTQSDNAHVIHMFTLLDHARAREIASAKRFAGKAHLYTTRARQQHWSFMLLGPYPDARRARIALDGLPEYFVRGARVRTVALIAQNRCKKREALDAQEARGLDAFCMQ